MKVTMMAYVKVFCSSLVQALACGLVFALYGFGATAFLRAFLVTFVADWVGFLCARLVMRWKLHSEYTYIIGAGIGAVLGSVSAFGFCYGIEIYPFSPFSPFLMIGGVVGIALGLINVRIWYAYACL